MNPEIKEKNPLMDPANFLLAVYELKINGKSINAHSFVPKDSDCPISYLINYYDKLNGAIKKDFAEGKIDFESLQDIKIIEETVLFFDIVPKEVYYG